MTNESPRNFEMTVLLPLDVVASKLMRIEEELRRINMKSLSSAKDSMNRRLEESLETRLEHLSETLDSIGALVADLDTNIGCATGRSFRTSSAESSQKNELMDDGDSTAELNRSENSHRKPQPERDD